MKIFHHLERHVCPRCQKKTLKSLPRRGTVDQVMRCLKRYPVRCDACRKRCYMRH